MNERPIQTFQTRLWLDDGQSQGLDSYAKLYGRIERCLFADMQKGIDQNQLKRDYLTRFQITGRQFNAIKISLEGKIDSIKSRRPELITEVKAKIKSVGKAIAKLTCKAKAQKAKSPSAPSTIAAAIHQKKRRLHILQTRLESLQTDQADGKVRLCFGSKRLFHAQFNLEANGYTPHDQWKKQWVSERSSSFFVLGSKDEVAGCQGCQAVVQDDGSLELTLRLPDGLSVSDNLDSANRLILKGVRFAYGQDQILAALNSSHRIEATTKKGKKIVKRTGTALSYRFIRDAKGWRVFVSCQAMPVAVKTSQSLGAIGIDLNADHLGVSEADRFGNLVCARRIELNTYGAATNQAKAMIGDAAVVIGQWASKAGKPLVIETLDFQKKKAELDKSGKAKKARMLSSFAYKKIASSLDMAAYRAGVEVIKVNPAYTSVIGAVNHAQRKGISIHQGAALAIARRGLGLSEKAAVHTGLVPAANGGHVTFELPARNRSKHVWSFWSKARANLKAAHAAHYRCGDHERPPPPLTPEMRSLCATRYSTAKPRGASHQQHCSADALGDVPW